MPSPLELTDDAFLGGALQILQPKSAYRAGLDAVLLAAAVPVRKGEREQILDAGAGVGVVGLSIARRCPDARVCLVEVEPQLVSLARENACRNRLDDRVQVIQADVSAGGPGLAEAGLLPGQFAHAVANPPYQADHRASRSPDALKARAHGMAEGALDGWLRFLASAVASRGTVTIVHRTEALPALLAAMSPRFGALKILPLQPRIGEPAGRLIVQGVKGSRGPLQLLPGLVLHGDGHAFLPEIEAMLRGVRVLTL